MYCVRNCSSSDKVILIHNGALGDFLLFWPAAWAVRQAWPQARMVWAGRSAYTHWLAPLHCEPCPAVLRTGLDRLYIAAPQPENGAAIDTLPRDAPEVLKDWLILWPLLTTLPPITPRENCFFLRGVLPGNPASPRQLYLAALSERGIAGSDDATAAFRDAFATARNPGDRVLLFPGAGHPLKQWPLDRFVELSGRISALGLRPLFVLGPAERDRGLVPQTGEWTAPESLEELEALILTAKAVVGGDTGPMHLAGMLGVPGVSLFGPTRFAQWGPPGMLEVNLDLPCSPCTPDCSDLACAHPRCLEELSVERVMQSLREVL